MSIKKTRRNPFPSMVEKNPSTVHLVGRLLRDPEVEAAGGDWVTRIRVRVPTTKRLGPDWIESHKDYTVEYWSDDARGLAAARKGSDVVVTAHAAPEGQALAGVTARVLRGSNGRTNPRPRSGGRRNPLTINSVRKAARRNPDLTQKVPAKFKGVAHHLPKTVRFSQYGDRKYYLAFSQWQGSMYRDMAAAQVVADASGVPLQVIKDHLRDGTFDDGEDDEFVSTIERAILERYGSPWTDNPRKGR